LSVTAKHVGSATLTLGDETMTFTQGDPGPKQMKWFPAGNGFAQLTFPGQSRPYKESGPWAVLRLFQEAQVNTAAGSVTAQFGGGADYVTFVIGLPAGSPNPFGSDPWAFRCPDAL
jgi:type VI protein secretion system component VasK